jgi:hypothetical protein
MKRISYVLLAALFLSAGSQPARADNLVNSLHLATGTDSAGNVITAGGIQDANWTVSNSGPSSTGSGPAFTTFPGNSDYAIQWVPNDSRGDWVAFDPNNASGNGTGIYTRTFSLSGNLSGDFLAGTWSIDDNGIVTLNGNTISTLGSGNWTSLHPFFAGSSLLQQGTNTLTIQILSSDFNYEAVRLQGTPTPEPSSLMLLGTGVLGLAGVLRRKLVR